MKRILLLLAHPRLEDSQVNAHVINEVRSLHFVTVRDLYEIYPDFNIDISAEKELLLQHDIIIWHHPIYWYSCPPLMKQWIDLVLEYGWAYGKNGDALSGKIIFNAVSAGGSKEVYQSGGRNRFTINEFLRPFEQTALLCKMIYLPPFVVHQANIADSLYCSSFGMEYKSLLQELHSNKFEISELIQRSYLNIHQYKNAEI